MKFYSYTSSTYFSITENDTTGEPGHLEPIQRQLRASCTSIGLGRSRDPRDHTYVTGFDKSRL